MAWNKTWPVSEGTGTSAVSGSTEQLRANWLAMEAVFQQEHVSIPSANAGDHYPGKTGFVYYGTTSAISAISSPGTGALAYTSDTGEFLIHVPSGTWDRVTEDYWSRIRESTTVAQTITNNLWTKVTIASGASGTYDGLSEFSSNRWTALGSGYYLIIGTVSYPSTKSNYYKAVAISKNGSRVSIVQFYGSAYRTVQVADIVSITAEDYLELYTSHLAGANVNITGASFVIHRIS